MGIDPSLRRRLGHPALIQCRFTKEEIEDRRLDAGFGTLMQSVDAKPFRGHRVKLRTELRAESTDSTATMWLRVDGSSKRTLSFDNMEDRPHDGRLVGTHDWTERRIVLDVAEEAESIHFGFYLRGAGKAWANGFDLTIADSDEVSTQRSNLLPSPTNLDFARKRQAA